jgi:SAM-dependent methyltransferase
MSPALAAVWHDVECGAYTADLPLWRRLAGEERGPVLELGCGTGRVALDLARRGHRVLGLDSDPELIAALRQRSPGPDLEAVVGDARDFELEARFGLALAPMQLLQMLGGEEARASCLGAVRARLRAGGLGAFAIVEEIPAADAGPPPSPDAAESAGWSFASLPLNVDVGPQQIRVRRLRQAISPGGEVSEELDEVSLARLYAPTLEGEAAAAGLVPCGRRRIAATEAHVGSTVVLARRAA